MSGPVGFEAWAALAGDSATSRTEWAAVVAAWSEPHRRYHDLAHLAVVLGLVAELGGAADIDVVRLAAWYHDVVYDPARTDNEEISARRARAGLRGLVDDDRVAEVERLVLLTAGHDPEPGDANGAVLCDADLAVLAGSPQRYAEYTAAIRREYAHVPDADFRAGRATVLRALLELPALYRLAPLAAMWEEPARANLEAELASLSPAQP
jgi:predicted metal-dependent HD superfamily phosphohydrolase